MKNTAYALAGEHLTGSIEALRRSSSAGTSSRPAARSSGCRVSIDEHAWRPIGDAPDAFTPRRVGDADGAASLSAATALAVRGRDRRSLGDEDDPLGVLRLPARPIHDARRDRRPDHGDEGHGRPGGTTRTAEIDFDASFEAVRSTFLEVVRRITTRRRSRHSIWIIGRGDPRGAIRRSTRSRCRCRTSITGRST